MLCFMCTVVVSLTEVYCVCLLLKRKWRRSEICLLKIRRDTATATRCVKEVWGSSFAPAWAGYDLLLSIHHPQLRIPHFQNSQHCYYSQKRGMRCSYLFCYWILFSSQSWYPSATMSHAPDEQWDDKRQWCSCRVCQWREWLHRVTPDAASNPWAILGESQKHTPVFHPQTCVLLCVIYLPYSCWPDTERLALSSNSLHVN